MNHYTTAPALLSCFIPKLIFCHFVSNHLELTRHFWKSDEVIMDIGLNEQTWIYKTIIINNEPKPEKKFLLFRRVFSIMEKKGSYFLLQKWERMFLKMCHLLDLFFAYTKKT